MNIYKYTIYTEDINRQEILRLLNYYGYVSFNISERLGYWQGKSEKSIAIEIIGGTDRDISIKDLVTAIKKINRQESILLTEEKIESYLL